LLKILLKMGSTTAEIYRNSTLITIVLGTNDAWRNVSMIVTPIFSFVSLLSISNFKPLVNFLLVDVGEGYCCSCFVLVKVNS